MKDRESSCSSCGTSLHPPPSPLPSGSRSGSSYAFPLWRPVTRRQNAGGDSAIQCFKSVDRLRGQTVVPGPEVKRGCVTSA